MRSILILLVITLVTYLPLKAQQDDSKINKLLVIGLVGDLGTRKIVEDEVQFQLQDAGIDALVSHNTTLRKEITKETVIAKCEDLGADGVLFVHVVDKKAPVEYKNKGNVSTHVYVWGGYIYSNGPYTPGANTKVKVAADLYRLADKKKIFGMNQTLHVGLDPEPVIGKFAYKVTKSLKRMPEIGKD